MDDMVDYIHRSKILTWVFLVSSQAVAQNEGKLLLILGAVAVVIYLFVSC